jgi:hypothetical protein
MLTLDHDRFSRALVSFAIEAQSRLDMVARNVCFLAAENIIIGGPFGNPTGTPVQFGFARGQWTPSLEVPEAAPAGRKDPGGQAPLAEALDTGARLQLGQSFWLSNGAAYINALENGHSQQAPQGMVGPVLHNAQALVDYVVRNTHP